MGWLLWWYNKPSGIFQKKVAEQKVTCKSARARIGTIFFDIYSFKDIAVIQIWSLRALKKELTVLYPMPYCKLRLLCIKWAKIEDKCDKYCNLYDILSKIVLWNRNFRLKSVECCCMTCIMCVSIQGKHSNHFWHHSWFYISEKQC